MDKKAIRSIPIKEFSGDTTEAIFRSGLEHILTTRVETASGERILVVGIYEIERINAGDKLPSIIVYLWSDNFISQFRKDGQYVWRNGMIDKHVSISQYFIQEKRCVFYTIRDEEVANSFFGTNDADPANAILSFQRQVRTSELEKRHDREKKKIDDELACIRELPKGFTRWIDKSALENQYIFYRKKGKRIFGYCSYCENDVLLKNAVHNTEGRCPLCGKRIRFKAERKQKGLCDTVRVTYMQRGKDRNNLVERVFFAVRYYDNYEYRNPIIDIHEECRFILHSNVVKKKCFTPYYYGNYHFTGEYRWCRGFTPIRCGSYTAAPEAMYTKNLTSILKNTPWQYSQINEAHKNIPGLDIGVYLVKYIMHPFIEYLVKLRLFQLVREIMDNNASINYDGRNLTEILGISKTELQLMQHLDVGSSQIELVKTLINTEIFDVASMAYKWIVSNHLEYRIPDLLKYVQCSKAMRYIERNKGVTRYDYFISDWLDYLSACKSLGYNLDDNRLLYPGNFRKAHDEAIQLNDERIAEEGNALIEIMEDEINIRYSYSDDDLLIRAPRSWKEILNEGQRLKHCCGAQYAKKVVEGKCLILLIRRKSNPFEPFYTMEYNQQTAAISQVRGCENSSMTDKVQAFVDKWKEIGKRESRKAA